MAFAPLVGFNSNKAAQIAAFLATKEPGIEKLKLIKLVYLSEREFIDNFGHPMLYDELYSFKHGPICSSTLNGINGRLHPEYWSNFVALKDNRYVIPKDDFAREILDEISDAEMDVLNSVWGQFGHMTASQIRRWTHEHCPEYTEIDEGRLPITYSNLLKVLEADNAEEIEGEIDYYRRVRSILSGE